VILSTVLVISAFAANWSGKLIDASCHDKQQSATGCGANGTATSFALDVAGKVYKLDAAGNQKASAAVKNSVDRAADPTKPPSTEIMAKAEGAERGNTIAAESVEVRKTAPGGRGNGSRQFRCCVGASRT
jgi:hypothetical protein